MSTKTRLVNLEKRLGDLAAAEELEHRRQCRALSEEALRILRDDPQAAEALCQEAVAEATGCPLVGVAPADTSWRVTLRNGGQPLE